MKVAALLVEEEKTDTITPEQWNTVVSAESGTSQSLRGQLPLFYLSDFYHRIPQTAEEADFRRREDCIMQTLTQQKEERHFILLKHWAHSSSCCLHWPSPQCFVDFLGGCTLQHFTWDWTGIPQARVTCNKTLILQFKRFTFPLTLKLYTALLTKLF